MWSLIVISAARSERYCHLGSDEDDETNDDESSLELRQFSSVAHRFNKVFYSLLYGFKKHIVANEKLVWLFSRGEQ